MKYIFNAAEMKAADNDTIISVGIPSAVLMERAALSVCDAAEEFFGLPGKHCPEILVLCGSGNNGGDGYAAARILSERGYRVSLLTVGNPEHRTEECARQAKICAEIIRRQICPSLNEYLCHSDAAKAVQVIREGRWSLIIDAIFGIGLTRDISGGYLKVIDAVNASGCAVASVDIPSGIDADDGKVRGTAVRADLTVTFAALKYGHVLFPGREYCGEVRVCQIGIPVKEAHGKVLEESDLPVLLPRRKARSNKGSYGRALIAAGGYGMAGAAVLAVKSACRSGVGLVAAAVHEANRTVIQSSVPEAVYLSWEDTEKLKEALKHSAAAAVGPGLGTGEEALQILRTAAEYGPETLVIDADALNLIVKHDLLNSGDLFSGSRALIVTPHPGEMSRLCGMSVPEIFDDLVGTAMRFAKEYHLICVLKDAVSVITDGTRVCLNQSGCDGMATGGSGDTLTGIICGLCAQGMDPFDAACTGTFLHGLAGRRAAAKKGMRGMTAVDLCDALPEAFPAGSGTNQV